MVVVLLVCGLEPGEDEEVRRVFCSSLVCGCGLISDITTYLAMASTTASVIAFVPP